MCKLAVYYADEPMENAVYCLNNTWIHAKETNVVHMHY